MNRFEAIKAAKDGLDVLPDLVRYARDGTPIEEIPEDDLDRMKWYGVFHRKLTPGFFMLRLRVTGGRLTAEQLRAIAGVAREHGRGTADITTRQNIQLRWLTLPVIPEVLARLEAAGVTTLQTGMDNMRNYVGCPLAGLDATEAYDATHILAELQQAHLRHRDFSNLPRKFNVSVSGCREDCGHAQTQDLGLIPASREVEGRQVTGFNVLAGGALGGTRPALAEPMDVFLRPEEVVEFVLALLAVYRDHGPREQRTRSRLKWLIAAWGMERLRAAVETALGRPLLRAGRDLTIRTAGDHLGVHPQRTVGVNYVGLHVPVGRITADQLEGLARLAAVYGANEVRLTNDQNVVIPHVTDARLDRLLEEPLLRELRPDPPGVWRGLVACTGNDYCHFSLIDTKARAVELVRALEERGVHVPHGTRIHVSGCVNACGKHHIADIGLEGTKVRVGDRQVEAVHLFAGGRLGAGGHLAERLERDVSLDGLPDLVETLLRERSATRAGVGVEAAGLESEEVRA